MTFYSPTELKKRQQTPVVRTFAELLAQITLCTQLGVACFVQLGCDIFCDRAIVLPATLKGLHIVGSGKEKLIVTQNLAMLFDVQNGNSSTLVNLELNNFLVSGNPYVLTCLVGSTSSSTQSISLKIVSIITDSQIDYLLGQTILRAQYSLFQNIILGYASNTELIGASMVNDSLFQNIVGNITIAISNSHSLTKDNCFVQILVDSVSNSYAASGFNYYFGVTGSPLTYDTSNDVVISGTAFLPSSTHGQLNLNQTAVSLTADNQTVAITGASYIQLTSDSAVANSRTFTLTGSPSTGQILVLACTNNGNVCDIVDDGGSAPNVTRLAGNFAFTGNDTLTLLWDGTAWVELSRSVN